MAKILQTDFASHSPDGHGPLLSALIDAKEETARLLGPDEFTRTVDAMVEAALGLGPRALFGASDAGHVLAGAMRYRSSRLSLWIPPTRASILLIDCVVVGMAGLSVAAQRARAIGADRVDALVVSAGSAEDWPTMATAVDEIVVLARSVQAAA